MSKLDRFRGCLIGAALGDALGAPYEFAKGPVGVDTRKFHRGVFGTAPGEPTDDSTLVGFLADALVEKAGMLDLGRYLDKLVEWKNSNPPDIGNTTASSVSHWERTRTLPKGLQTAQGNGGVMAVAPIGLLWSCDPDTAQKAGEQFSKATHPSDESIECCGKLARAIAQLTCDQPVDVTQQVKVGWKVDGPEMGWCTGTTWLAFSAIERARTAEDAMPALVATIRMGGDTDTNACVAGALLGAKFGMAAWPRHLVDELTEFQAMQDRAAWLYALSQ